jgi:hypothetical protein
MLMRAWHPQPHLRPSATEFTATIANLLDQLKQQTRRRAGDPGDRQGDTVPPESNGR